MSSRITMCKIGLALATMTSQLACETSDDDGSATVVLDASSSGSGGPQGTTSADDSDSESVGTGAGTTTRGTTGAPDPESTGDATGGTSGGSGETYSVSGTVTRADGLAVWPDNDGVGTFYLAALGECNAETVPLAVTQISGLDLSVVRSSGTFELNDLAAGTYYLAGFLDDNGNADATAPAPDQGDLVLASGVAMGCVQVDVVDADIDEVEFVLNLVLPF